MAGPLAEIYSASDSFKRKLVDALRNPRAKLEQIVGDANDRARNINEMTAAAGAEGADFGPASRRLANAMADAYNPAGIFIGANSTMFNKDMALRASQLAKKGVDQREIWRQTGTFKAPDGFLRQEIDDSASKFIDAQGIAAKAQALRDERAAIKETLKPNRTGQKDLFPKELTEARKPLRARDAALNQELNVDTYGPTMNPQYRGNSAPYAYEHQALYEAYPELRNVVVKQGAYQGDGLHGSLSGQLVEVNSPAFREPGGARSTATHEMQHAVQDIEGFAPGGNSEYAYRLGSSAWNRIREINDEMSGLSPVMDNSLLPAERQAAARARYNELMAERDTLRPLTRGSNDPYGAYRALHGEAEARATQKRIDYPMSKRREIFPLDDYDIPVDQLIITKNNIVDALRKRK